MGNETESPIEARLISAMKRIEDYREPVRQHEVYDEKGHLVTVPDFAYPEVKIAIFCDGQQYHEVPVVQVSDKKKREYLTSSGWLVLAYSGAEINADAGRCAREIHAKYLLRSESSTDERCIDDWLNRDKPDLGAGPHNICSASQMYSKKYHEFSKLDQIIMGHRYQSSESALIATNEEIFKTVFNYQLKTHVQLIDRNGLFLTRNGRFFIQHEYPSTKRKAWIEAVGPSRAYEFFWNSSLKVQLPVNSVFKEVGVRDG